MGCGFVTQLITRVFIYLLGCSFRVRGKIYGKQEVRTMESGAGGGLFFTGEGAGVGGGGVAVWKWLSQAQTAEKDSPQ